jgi:hypothetical protein
MHSKRIAALATLLLAACRSVTSASDGVLALESHRFR